MPLPEFWLRGPLPGFIPLVQPIAHAIRQAQEEIGKYVTGFPEELLWEKPAGLASVGFHLQHLRGVLDRLFTYARNEMLTPAQLEEQSAEGEPYTGNDSIQSLVAAFDAQVEKSLLQLAGVDEQSLTETRMVGRLKVPSTTIGLLVHAAEHTMRHTGQLLVTVKWVTSNLIS